MSLFPAVINLLKEENRFLPITGDLLLIGRQTIERSEQTDESLFASFCSAKVQALDVSPYEGAEIIHDLNQSLPPTLHCIADFIFDGSCLDNIFNPAEALQSFSKLLRPGGRMVLMEHGTAIQGAITTFSPEWFFDFFAVNGYEDCQISLFTFANGMHGKWKRLDWRPFNKDDMPVTATPGTEIGNFVILVTAEKGTASTDTKVPIQAQYRLLHGSENALYLAAHKKYLASKRAPLPFPWLMQRCLDLVGLKEPA